MRKRTSALLVAATACATTGTAAAELPDVAVGALSASSVGSSTDVECDLPLGDANADDSNGVLVMLLDGTVSSESQQGRVDDLVSVLDAATADRQLTVSVGSFGGTDADVRYDRCLDGIEFVARGNNDRTRERNREPLLEGAGTLIAALAGGYESSDPTAALRAGVARVTDATGDAGTDADTTRLLVIHTDGIPTAGCAALPEQVDVSDAGLVDRLVAQCVDAGQLPDASGIDIVVGGVARTDEQLDDTAVSFVIELNTALCEATGASCRVDPNFPTSL